jgi:hypothetical protein
MSKESNTNISISKPAGILSQAKVHLLHPAWRQQVKQIKCDSQSYYAAVINGEEYPGSSYGLPATAVYCESLIKPKTALLTFRTYELEHHFLIFKN